MNDTHVVSVLDRTGNRDGERRGQPRLQRLSVLPAPDGRAVHELERDIRHTGVLADVEHLDDVWVMQPRKCLGLHAEPSLLGRSRERAADYHLERNEAVQAPLPGFVDHPHPTATDLLENLIPRDRYAASWTARLGC